MFRFFKKKKMSEQKTNELIFIESFMNEYYFGRKYTIRPFEFNYNFLGAETNGSPLGGVDENIIYYCSYFLEFFKGVAGSPNVNFFRKINGIDYNHKIDNAGFVNNRHILFNSVFFTNLLNIDIQLIGYKIILS